MRTDSPKRIRQREPWLVDTDVGFVAAAAPTTEDSALLLRCGTTVLAIRLPDGGRVTEVVGGMPHAFRRLHDASQARGPLVYVNVVYPRTRLTRRMFRMPKRSVSEMRASISIVGASLDYHQVGHWHELIIMAHVIGHDGSLGPRVRAGDRVRIAIRVPGEDWCLRLAEIVAANLNELGPPTESAGGPTPAAIKCENGKSVIAPASARPSTV
ncbi:MAG: hypothetical protein ABFE07_06570 [Armatimonadia bacterium]